MVRGHSHILPWIVTCSGPSCMWSMATIENGTTVAYAWTEDRKGLPPEQYPDGEIYAYVNSAVSGVHSLRQVSAKKLSLLSLYPNPAGAGEVTIGFAIPESGNTSLILSSSDGA